MRKIHLALLISIFMIFLVACNSSEQDHQAEATFTGSIVNIEGETAIVAIEEGDIIKSGQEVVVDLSVAGDDVTFKVLDKIKVGYDGPVMESHPLQINTVFVELVK